MITIAIANQKGGCGKTTTAINLAASLGRAGQRVLLIDMDPQGHASLGLGQRSEDRPGLYEVFIEEVELKEATIVTGVPGVDLVPATISLAAIEHLLSDLPRRERQLTDRLEAISRDYDYAILDCPPSLGLLSFNGLRAADLVLIPIEMSVFALDGVERLSETISLLEERYQLEIPTRLLPTLVDYRCRFTQDTLSRIREQFGTAVLPLVVHYTVRLKEAAAQGRPIIDYWPDSLASQDYRALAAEMLKFGGKAAVLAHVPIPASSSRPIRMAEPAAPKIKPRAVVARDSRLNVVLSLRDVAGGDIKIAGDFNDWQPDAGVETDHRDGALVKILRLRPGTYQYRLVVDGNWCEDPSNPRLVVNQFGELNSVLEVAESREAVPA